MAPAIVQNINGLTKPYLEIILHLLAKIAAMKKYTVLKLLDID